MVQRHTRLFSIRVPGSCANLGVGFDCLAVAIDRYLTIDGYEEANLIGRWWIIDTELDVPKDQNNLIIRVAEDVCRQSGILEIPFHIRLVIKSELPLEGGQGSSAAAIVAGILLAEHICGVSNSNEYRLKIASAYESHLDNLGACIFGNIVCIQDFTVKCLREIASVLKLTIIETNTRLSTKDSRAVLPKEIHLNAVVSALQCLAKFVCILFEASGKRNDTLIYEIKDVYSREILHHPYRIQQVLISSII